MSTSEAVTAALRLGDRTALPALADILEEQGAAEASAALRGLAALLDGWELEFAKQREQRTFLTRLSLVVAGRWHLHGIDLAQFQGLGDLAEKVLRQGDSAAVAGLLRHWDECHPAVECVARCLDFMAVEVVVPDAPPGQAPRPCYLRKRQKLKPLPGTSVAECNLRP